MRLCALIAAVAAVAAPALANEIPIFVIAGQSNATGAGTSYSTLAAGWKVAQTNVLYSGPQESAVNWANLTPPTQYSQVDGGSGFGPEISVGKTISSTLGGIQVGETKFSINGTNLYSQWNPDTPGSYYAQMLARVNDALTKLPVQKSGTTGKVAGFFWMQGESDALAGRTAAQYQADLTHLISHVRADFGDPSLPFIIGRITTVWSNAQAVRDAQAAVAATVPRTYMLDTDGLERSGGHYTSQGTVDMGIGFANGYLAITPEPASASLLALAGLAVLRRRRG